APPRLVLLGEGQIEQPVSGTEEEGYVRCMACAVDEVERRRARCRTPAEVVGIGLWLVLADQRSELIDILGAPGTATVIARQLIGIPVLLGRQHLIQGL